jgi:hypothetical protein
MGYPGAYAAPAQGGFLRSAAQTAAGVAAGALAFEGIESLMHGFGHAAGYGSSFGSGFGGVSDFGGAGRPEEIINNYYGASAPGSEHASFLSNSPAGLGPDHVSDHITDHPAGDHPLYETASDRTYDDSSSAHLSDASYTTGAPTDTSRFDDPTLTEPDSSDSPTLDTASGDDSAAFDDPANPTDSSTFDDPSSGLDDSSSFDSGGFDDSGSGDSSF